MRLPAEPILAYETGELAHQMTARHGGTYAGHRRLLHRAEATGSITLAAADKVAVALGTHPLFLWGRAWERPGESVGDPPGQAAEDEAALAAAESAEEPGTEPSSPRILKPPFPYYGAKQHIASWIARHLPSHEHYVEPFAGSLAVLLAKARSPQETINDLDEDLIAFWRILRERPDELTRACLLTPHSRSEFAASLTRDGVSELERARRVWVQLTQGRAATTRPSKRGWRNRRGPGTSLPQYLAAYVGRIPQAAERLAGVSLECRPAEELIEAYGRCPSVCLYVDPPYLATTRSSVGYSHEMGDGPGHERLAEALHATRCSVVLSGYPSTFYDRLYAGWSRMQCASQTVRGGVARVTTEVLWIKEAHPARRRAQLSLFDEPDAEDCELAFAEEALGRPESAVLDKVKQFHAGNPTQRQEGRETMIATAVSPASRIDRREAAANAVRSPVLEALRPEEGRR